MKYSKSYEYEELSLIFRKKITHHVLELLI